MGGLDKGLMRGRLGVYYGTSSNTESSVEGVNHQAKRLGVHGGNSSCATSRVVLAF